MLWLRSLKTRKKHNIRDKALLAVTVGRVFIYNSVMGRSKSAKICERILKRVILPKGETMEDVILAYRRQKGERMYDLPLMLKIQKNIDKVMSDDLQLFYMNVESESDKLIVYLHGGAYVSEFLPFHWLLLDKITSRIDSTFIIPDYPLAPYNDFRDAYQKLTKFYEKCLKYYPDKQIIFMGDSAGGGLCAGLNLYFHEVGLPVVDKLILLSPWVDLIMDDPEIEKYVKVDPSLQIGELRADAYYWANGTDLHDFRLSPIYGDLSCLKDVTLFTGTHEIFYPDISKFHMLLKANGVKSRLFVGEELNHVYPAYPIPEAEEAIENIVRIISGEE